jgi:hypothetical protein
MLSFDSSPTVYWFLAYTLVIVVLGLNLKNRIPNALFLLAAVGLLVMMRLPTIVFNRELNADESQMLSHALTLYLDPIYWRSVDGTTIGPLDNYLLVVPRLLGFQLDYTAARSMGLLCTAGSLMFFFVALRCWFGTTIAKIILLVPLLFYAFTQETDFVNYTSEQLPLLLLNACLTLVAILHTNKTVSTIPAYMLGFLAGMVPFTKLQAVPQAAILVLAGLFITYQYYQKTKRFKPLLVLLLGGISFPAMAMVWISYHGVYQDFINFYILGNVVYASGAGLRDIPTQLGQLIITSPDFTALLFIATLVLIAGLISGRRSQPPHPVREQSLFLPLLILGYGLAAIYAATKTGHLFVHYLNFCVYPIALTFAFPVQRLSQHKYLTFLVPALILGWFGVQDALSFYKTRQLNTLVSVGATTLPESPVVKALKAYTNPNDQMVVWGWQCSYYVEAQLAQGTAENHTERCIFQHPLRDVYRERFINDLRRTQPAVFIDAVGKNSLWVQDVKSQGYENFPALADYVSDHYSYLGAFDSSRLYVRKDRVPTRSHPKEVGR